MTTCIYKAHTIIYRDEIDVSKYVYQELSNVTVVKEAGELNGQAFHIESCDVSYYNLKFWLELMLT